ncbi:MAG: ATP-dependent Clp protease adaptor ClpS [Bacteroidales bacterium]|nr:ATP-dependent Clp protease adaptor ClpS [Bacteroidales bacterium]
MKEKISRKNIEKFDKTTDKFLVLHNDDFNTFEHVIDCLVKIVKHEPFQAEQCAYLTHYKGKCDIKKGSESELRNMRKQLVDNKLKVSIQ